MKRNLFFFIVGLFLTSLNLSGLTINSISNQVLETQLLDQTFNKLGEHIIVEFLDCQNLDDFNQLESILRRAAQTAGATVLSVDTHKFEPQGMTGVAVLQESHISVHTWPEYGYAAIDIFTCGLHVDVEKALAVLEKFFGPKQTSIIKIARGFDIN